MKEMSGVQITMSFWKSILSTIPDFFELLERFKNYSYYYDTVVRDLKFTNETLTITPPDELCRDLELKLQEKQIPFVKGTADIAKDNVKASGFYVYYCRTLDYKRVYDVIEEINKRSKDDPDKDKENIDNPEKAGQDDHEGPEDDLEPELERDADAAAEEEKTEESESDKGPDETDPGEEDLEEDEDSEEEKKASKHKKSKKKSSITPYPVPAFEHQEEERREQERLDEARRNEIKQEEERRQTEQRAEEERRFAEQHREREYQEAHNKQDTHDSYRTKEPDTKETPSYQSENNAPQEHREESSYGNFASERYDRNENRRAEEKVFQTTPEPHISSRGPEVQRAAGADADSRIAAGFGGRDGFYRTDEPAKSTPSYSAELNSSSPKEPIYEEKEVKSHVFSAPVNDKLQSGERREERKENPVSNPIYTSSDRTGSSHLESYDYSTYDHGQTRTDDIREPDRTSSSYEAPQTPLRTEAIRPNQSTSSKLRGYVERSALASGNRDVNVDFSHRDSSGETRQEQRGVHLLGTAETLSDEIPSQNSAGFISRAWKGMENTYEPQDSIGNSNSYSGNISSDALQDSANSRSDASKITIQDNQIQNNKNAFIEPIRKNKILNDAKEVLAPKHFRPVIKSAQRIVGQAVVSRDTEGGRIANEVVDNVSPVASAMLATMMSNGALNLTSQTFVDNETLTAFYMAVHSCDAEEAKGSLRFLTRANIDSEAAGATQISMYAFDKAFKLNADDVEGIGQQIKEITNKINELRSKQTVIDPDTDAILILQKELDQLKGQKFLAEFRSSFGATSPGGFGLKPGETFTEWFGRASSEDIMKLIGNMNISDELKIKLSSLRMDSADLLNELENLKRQFGSTNDAAILNLLSTGRVSKKYHAGVGGVMNTLRKGMQKNLLKVIAGQTDAGRAFGEVTTMVSTTYSAYKAGMKLLLHTMRKFGAINIDASGMVSFMGRGAMIEKDLLLNPVKSVQQKAANKAGKVTGRVLDRMGLKNPIMQTRRAVVQHASSALKFLAKPVTEPVKNLILKLGLDKVAAAAFSKLAVVASAVVSVIGWILVAVIILIIVGEGIDSQRKVQDQAPVNGIHNDNEIIQEVITELTQKNNQFMADINDAANHRNEFNTTTGLVTNENVSFYEAYNVIFRDAETGLELEPSHVDLNNTKAILSMASRFMPYPLQKPSEHASEQTKKDYEDMAQHFKDYCYFLWASTHQISIEEYHPGNSDGVEGAVDNSGLMTTLDKGKCDKDGTTLWLKSDFTKDIVKYEGREWICDSCSDIPETGMGIYLDDLCTHGKDGNAHGGWRMTGNSREVYNCKEEHNHVGCDDENCYTYTCEDLRKDTHKHKEYEWVYDCGGHMGAVVYVTIGDLSRDPSFPAAKDVDYDAVGKYDTGEELNGSDIVTNPESSGNQ